MFSLANGPYTATFDPEHGMNMLSFRRGDIEAIAQSTRPLFEERRAGLGALIGPHFHHRPHVDPEPYSHGIARQLPWECQHDATTFSARLEADEDQHFTMHFNGALSPEGLTLQLSIASDTDSVVGFHYYYSMTGPTTVRSQIKPGEELILPIDQPYDNNYSPADPLHGEITLETATHTLHVNYTCPNEWNSWQLWHPEGADFVCIEPLSARNPRKPLLSVSAINQILVIKPAVKI